MLKTTRIGLAIGGSLLALTSVQTAHAQMTTFTVTLENLTNSAPNSGQTFSPAVFYTHDGSLELWQMGGTASDPLRQIAEEGNNQPLLTDLSLAGNALGTVKTLSGVQLPGRTQTFSITTDLSKYAFLTDVWMLGRTNDGFSGQASINLAGITTTPTVFNLVGFDAGTEVNNELAAYLPALGGAFNDPENGVITLHTGIRGDADAPASWNFSGAVARVTIGVAPESSTLILLVGGFAACGLIARRKRV